MRQSLEILQNKVMFLGTDLEEKDIELRGILMEIIELLEIALPKEVEMD